uniref:Protein kinase domain-containing protein n=1 Tax=Tetraselmis chuii TaxID=63592 RepID=A0A7S1T0I1_9CHLO|mmetsp:Transcript_3749/g.6866  ORF Transcript_3749/g.6866 Transcript_3749/m.6866 type:complete len:460 (+) Transcript_3749:269-1648(+)
MTGIYIRFNVSLLLLLPFLFPEDNSGVAAGRALRLPRRDALSRALKANSTLAASLDEPAAGAPPLPPPTLSPSGLRCEFKTVKRQKDKPNVPHNELFDNYTTVSYDVTKRYKSLHKLGRGVEGTVTLALDLATNTEVAIKKVVDIARNEHHVSEMLKEVMLYNAMIGLGGTVQLKRILPPLHPHNMTTLFMVMERMDGDMFHEKTTIRDMDLRIQKWLIYQALTAIQNMHAAGILHQDISATNIMVRSDCSVKLGDFGYTQVIPKLSPPEEFKDGEMTIPPQSNWVKDPAIDVWHMGKSILTMASGADRAYEPEDRDHLARAMLHEYGSPPGKVLAKLNPDVVKVISEAERSGEQLPTFSSIWPEVHPDLMGLVKRMLHWDLRQLPTAAELMMDPIFDEIIDLRGPRVADKKFIPFPWKIRKPFKDGKVFKALSLEIGIIDELLQDSDEAVLMNLIRDT